MTTISANAKSALDDFIEAHGTKDLPGIIVGVADVDGEIYFKGSRNKVIRDPTSGEIDADSVLWICSQTKMITALAALKLIDQGKLSLDTAVADYLPALRNPVIVETSSNGEVVSKPAQTTMTVKHLLNFTSGLFYSEGRSSPNALAYPYTSKEMHAKEDALAAWFEMVIGDLPGVPIKFEPGTNWVYGWSSDVLGFLIEKVAGTSLENFFKEHIFDPLGMSTASFYLTPNLRKDLVDLTFQADDGTLHPWADQMEIIERDPQKLRLHLGGVGLYSSTRDYLTLLRHIMQINAGHETAIPAIWTQETIRHIFIPVLNEHGSKGVSEMIMAPSTQWGAAMAISTEDAPEGRRKGTAFWGGWAGTSHFIDPIAGIAVVCGTQITPSGDMTMRKLWVTVEELIYSGINGEGK